MDMPIQIQQTLSYIEQEVHKVSLFLKKKAVCSISYRFSLREKPVGLHDVVERERCSESKQRKDCLSRHGKEACYCRVRAP